MHFGQIIDSGKLTSYAVSKDKQGKEITFDRIIPREFFFYVGMLDILSTKEDVDSFECLLEKHGSTVVRYDIEGYDHNSLLWHHDAHEKVSYRILAALMRMPCTK